MVRYLCFHDALQVGTVISSMVLVKTEISRLLKSCNRHEILCRLSQATHVGVFPTPEPHDQINSLVGWNDETEPITGVNGISSGPAVVRNQRLRYFGVMCITLNYCSVCGETHVCCSSSENANSCVCASRCDGGVIFLWTCGVREWVSNYE